MTSHDNSVRPNANDLEGAALSSINSRSKSKVVVSKKNKGKGKADSDSDKNNTSSSDEDSDAEKDSEDSDSDSNSDSDDDEDDEDDEDGKKSRKKNDRKPKQVSPSILSGSIRRQSSMPSGAASARRSIFKGRKTSEDHEGDQLTSLPNMSGRKTSMRSGSIMVPGPGRRQSTKPKVEKKNAQVEPSHAEDTSSPQTAPDQSEKHSSESQNPTSSFGSNTTLTLDGNLEPIPQRKRLVSASAAIIQEYIRRLHAEGLGSTTSKETKNKPKSPHKDKIDEETDGEENDKPNPLLEIPASIAGMKSKTARDRRKFSKPHTDHPGPGELAVGRRGSIRISQVPMKLTNSEMDLLASTTGPFRAGPSDAHWKFLTRSKTVRLTGANGTLPPSLAAQMYASMGYNKQPSKNKGRDTGRRSKQQSGKNTAEERRNKNFIMRHRVSIHGLMGFTVGKPVDTGFDKWKKDELSFLKGSNPAKYQKRKAKEVAKNFLMSRWENLEETRI
jgi:hypothetical protein